MINWNTKVTPPGDYSVLRENIKLDLNESLLDEVLLPANLKKAWQQVRANKGTAGVDGISIEQFLDWSQQHWKQVRAALESGKYRPQPVKRVEIAKPDGGKRMLGIPTVLDRVIQQAITQILNPIFDPTFSKHSYGFRPSRNAAQAVREVTGYIKQNRKVAVDVDLSKFFDRVNHDLLMTKLAVRIHDKRLLKLIGRYLRAGIMDGKQLKLSKEGVPQGGPLSPLLSNIMLDSLDRELESRHHKFSRYADDFIILVKSERAGKRVLNSISRYLKTRLKLVVNTEKSQVVKVNQSKFLGFTFSRGNIQWHSKSLHQFKHKVRELTSRNWGVSMRYQLYKLSQYLRGWINYYGIANVYQKCIDLDHWIRRRVRMCYWRQWRKTRTKVTRLLQLGANESWAVTCGATRKGPWRSSKTPGIQQALSNNFLKEEGLISLREGWIKIHYPNG